MAKSKSEYDRDEMERVWGTIVAVLLVLLLFLFLFLARHCLSLLQGRQTASLRGVQSHPMVENTGAWRHLDDAFAEPTACSADMQIFPNIDPEWRYNFWQVNQSQAIQEPVDNINNAGNATAAAEADLDMWLVVAEVASLPRQIERDEASMMVTRPRLLSSVAESGVTPSSLVPDDEAATAPQHVLPQDLAVLTVAADAPVPEVIGILARIPPQQIEDEADAEAQVPAQVAFEVEVALEDSPPGMLELITDVARPPQFAVPSMIVPAGGVESQLEERIRPVDLPEAGDSSADFQGELGDIQQDDVENLEVES